MGKARMVGQIKPHLPNSRAEKPYWEVRRDGVPLAYGPKASFPTESERKALRDGGHKVYVEGKIFKEPVKKE
jgi:hypothetical protein